jgi:predicted acylesterase/phospholipase RssA
MAKRAICLAGGGPAAGLHMGVLKGLEDNGLKFDTKDDVWALSCIGAWVGIVYNQATKNREIDETIKFFRDVFRKDKSFESFPANTVFTPDWAGNAEAMLDFLMEPRNYRNAFLPKEIMKSFMHTMSAIRRGSAMRRRTRTYGNEELKEYEFKEFSEGDFNRWTLNEVLAVNPAVRFLTALLYKSKMSGLSRLYYPDSSFLKQVNFDEVRKREPFIYYNAWNLSRQELVLFANRDKKANIPIDKSRRQVKVEGYRPIDLASLCACSALPFIEQTVTIDGDIYCEGAMIDTVNFANLLEDQDLEEIWISRIIDANQVLPPRNLVESLANLCELFCATVGEDNIEIFKLRLQLEQPEREIRIIEIPVDSTVNFEWSHSNLEQGVKAGEAAAKEAYKYYLEAKHSNAFGIITPTPTEPVELRRHIEIRQQRRRELAMSRLDEAGRADW